MTDELRKFTTNREGRIVIDDSAEEEERGKVDRCTCRNGHKPLDGYIYTDPGCKYHGMSQYMPTEEGIRAEFEGELREAQAEAQRKRLMQDKRKGRDPKMSSGPTQKTLNFDKFVGTGEPVS